MVLGLRSIGFQGFCLNISMSIANEKYITPVMIRDMRGCSVHKVFTHDYILNYRGLTIVSDHTCLNHTL